MESLLLTVFGILALTLTAIGIYGVVAYSVAQRTREVGIRMALGAQKRDVLKMILTQGLALVAWGTAIGLIACYWLSRLVLSQLYGVSAFDPATLVSRGGRAHCRGPNGDLHSGAAGDESRSAGGASLRVGRDF